MKSLQRLLLASVASAALAFPSISFAVSFPGSVKTVPQNDPSIVNQNIYQTREQVWLLGEGFNAGVIVYYTVQSPGGDSLLRDGAGNPQANRSTKTDANGRFLVPLFPFAKTSNSDGEYQAKAGGSATALTKGDNFKVLADVTPATPPTPPAPPPPPADTVPPVIEANNLTVEAGADCSGTAFFNATATDNVDGAVAVTYTYKDAPISTGQKWDVGVYTITANAQDAAGNKASKTFTLTVVDNTKPVIAAPANITVSTAPGLCSAVVPYDVTATDNCGVASLVVTPASGSVFAKGTTTVNVTATDLAGNVSTASFTVTVVDTEAPLVSCIATTNPSAKNVPTAGATAGKSGQNPDGFYQLLGSDNCDGTNIQLYVKDSASSFVAGPFKTTDKIKLIQAPGATPNQKLMPQGYTQIQLKGDGILTATDSSGNIGRCSCLVPQNPK